MKTDILRAADGRTAAFVAVMLGMLTWAHAELLVYEGFNGYSYGDLADQAASNAIGLAGSYQKQGGLIEHEETGLAFSDLAVSGGAAFNAGGNPIKTGSYGIEIGSGILVAGTLYCSYLVELGSGPNSASEITLGVNATATADTAARYFNSSPDAALSKGPGLAYDATVTIGGARAAIETTYIVICEFTNVNAVLSAGAPGVATLWMLTESQFDHFKADGFHAEELNAASIGPAGTEVFSRLTSAVTSGAFTFNGSNGMQLSMRDSSAGGGPFVMDEIRWGTTLDDVLPVVR